MKQHSVQFKEGLRVTSDDSGLLIEVTEYHAKPLKLSWERFGSSLNRLESDLLLQGLHRKSRTA